MSALTIRAQGVEFRAQVQGAQPDVVLIHGFAGDLQTWDPLWDALTEERSVLRYDLRGFGGSVSRDDAPFTHADDLLGILDAAQIAQCDLMAVSMGGAVALNFTLDHPERVRKLVLISPAIVAWEWSSSWRARMRSIEERARSGAMDEARQLWWEHPLFATTRASGAAEALRQSIQRYSGKHWIHDSHTPMLPDVERLHLLANRTLLLSGGRDLDEFRLMSDLIAASAADLVRVEFPSAGHLIHLEEPERCGATIASFLAD